LINCTSGTKLKNTSGHALKLRRNGRNAMFKYKMVRRGEVYAVVNMNDYTVDTGTKTEMKWLLREYSGRRIAGWNAACPF
jgi:hypothetical protein